MFKKFAVLSLVLAAGAVRATPSDAVPTSELTAYFHVLNSLNDEVDGTVCSADLYRKVQTAEGEELQSLEIGAGDKLSCTFDDATLPIGTNGVSASGLPYSTERPYSFELVRANGEVHRTQTMMPYQIQITAPASGVRYAAGEEMRFTWTQGDYDMIFRLAVWDSECPTFNDNLSEEGDDYELFKKGYTKGCGFGTNYYLKGVAKFGDKFTTGLAGQASGFTTHHVAFIIGNGTPSTSNPTPRLLKRIRGALDRTMRSMDEQPEQPTVRSLRL